MNLETVECASWGPRVAVRGGEIDVGKSVCTEFWVSKFARIVQCDVSAAHSILRLRLAE